MTGVNVIDLEKKWVDSSEEPLPLVQLENPDVETGSYVVEPGERVPETGTTSHEGDELSVVLSGTIMLGVDGETYSVDAGMLTHIPAGIEHFSENRGSEPVRLVYTVFGGL